VTNELSAHDITALQAVMQLISERVDVIGERTFKLPGLLARFQRTGIIDYQTAAQINMVGPAGRASGVKLDVRADHSYGHYKYFPPYKLTLDSGDIFARAYMRYLEIQRSLRLIMDMLDGLPQQGGAAAVIKSLPPESMTVSMVEGPRGEIIHILITGSNGEVIRYKIKDASFNNWFALGLAMRNEGISDFPICNKSFDLSYCGHDL
jgi:Ni,Fe-hydrogenase III large subunit